MKNTIFFITLFLSSLIIVAQVKDEKARDLLENAIKLMDNGETNPSIKLLEQAKQIEPNNYIFDYEIGFAYYLNKDYKNSLKVFKKTAKYESVPDQVYQMLGNLYDINGNPKKALKAYEEGLERFPNSGRLYLESGNVFLNQKEYNQALNYYEKGIELDPGYPSNYYRTARLYLNSDQKIWGVIYGETFINLERGTERTSEISKMLYDTYKSQITFKDDTVNVNFFKRVIYLSSKDLKGDMEGLLESMKSKLEVKFADNVYETTLMLAAIALKGINLESLNTIRNNFIDLYFSNKHNEDYPLPLFDFHRKVIEAGFGEAYNYWLLSAGEEEIFEAWLDNNRGTWVSFLDWYKANQFPIGSNDFYSLKYK